MLSYRLGTADFHWGFNIYRRDVQRKNVVNNVDILSLKMYYWPNSSKYIAK